eukprot:1392094-Rhodomonas_salina.3
MAAPTGYNGDQHTHLRYDFPAVLRARYAMSGTDLGDDVRPGLAGASADPIININSGIALRAPYAMSGTDLDTGCTTCLRA